MGQATGHELHQVVEAGLRSQERHSRPAGSDPVAGVVSSRSKKFTTPQMLCAGRTLEPRPPLASVPRGPGSRTPRLESNHVRNISRMSRQTRPSGISANLCLPS